MITFVTDAYLSPRTPRWSPTTEGDIESALRDGLLEETHFLDLKREIAPGRAANKELARDLAQFAIDGGTLLVGVAEVKDSLPQLEPQPLHGLSERVEQVARSLVDPPLAVTTAPIQGGKDAGMGYPVVQVAASGQAPHMVEGVYYGRGDKTRTRLSDEEVRRLHAGRAADVEPARHELARYVERDPIPADLRRQAHLFVVAVPLTPQPEMMLSETHSQDAHAQLYSLLTEGGRLPDGLGQSFAPNLSSSATFQRRSDGAAMTSGLDSGRVLVDRGTGRFNEDVFEVEVSEDGVIRLLTTRLSDEVRDGSQMLFPTMMPILVRQAVGIAAAVAHRASYGGMWSIGVAATGVAGLPIYDGRAGWDTGRVSSDLARYERFTQASSVELAQHPGDVANRLVGRFLRGAGIGRCLRRLEEGRIARHRLSLPPGSDRSVSAVGAIDNIRPCSRETR
nr:hypothetical protein [Dietzia maris]